ncbi:MAG: response regulator [Anaerolineae bacterium]|nr:response regulator [Gemmatimonadaceae bacterium]
MQQNERPARPPLVLIANEQEWSARSLESILGPNGYAVLRAYTGRQALELARGAQPDAVLLDIRMPDIEGLEVCQLLRDDPRFNVATPIVITASGPTARAQRLAAYRAGAWEFFGQPLDGEVLLIKLATFMRAKRVIDRVQDDILVDQTTGLYNLRGLARRAREMGAEASRRHDALSCVAFSAETDVVVGSDRGTEDSMVSIVEQLGALMRRTGRASDAIGRLGQSEFAIIAPGTEASGAIKLVERLRASVESTSTQVGERAMRIRAGYSAVPDFADSSVDAVEVLLRATTALRYLRTEQNGRDIRSFDELPQPASGLASSSLQL